MFSAISLYADRPFEVGDFVLIDDVWGYIRHIGWRTTRMDALNGQETIFPNSDLTTSRVHNYTRMRRRRVVFDIGIVYGTATEQVKAVPGLIEEAVEEADNTTFDRSHFKAFGASSLEYETVYFVESPSYGAHMDALQSVLFGVMDRLRDRGIDIAFPSRSLYIESLPEAVRGASVVDGRPSEARGGSSNPSMPAASGRSNDSSGRDDSASDGAN
jgi:small-conductance mechanosensitive channel